MLCMSNARNASCELSITDFGWYGGGKFLGIRVCLRPGQDPSQKFE